MFFLAAEEGSARTLLAVAPLMLKPVALVGDEVRTGGGGVILDGLNDGGVVVLVVLLGGELGAEPLPGRRHRASGGQRARRRQLLGCWGLQPLRRGGHRKGPTDPHLVQPP
jgi:hypothetical protein